MIAVTGGNGLLGSFIIRKLIATGYPFIAIKRNNSDVSLLSDVADKIQWRDADVMDPVALDNVLNDVTQVIHTAAIVSYNPRDKNKLYNINVLGTRNLINSCLNHNIKRFVHISSVAALGKQKDDKVVDESQKWINNPLNTSYGESKYLAELEVMRGQEEGLSTVLINPSVILAPADWDKSSAKIFKYVWQEKSFYVDGSLNYVDVRDVASIAVKLLEAPYQAERFIANTGTVEYNLLFKTIAKNFKRKSPSIKLTKTQLQIIAWIEHLRAIVTGSDPLITSETAKLSGSNVFYSNEKVKNKLNHQFISLEKSLEWCCEHYIRQLKN